MKDFKTLLNSGISLFSHNRKIGYLLIFAVVLILAVLSFLLIRSNLVKQTPPSTTPKLVKIVTPIEEITIEITKTGFFPSTVKVKKGSQLTWLNQDTKPHQIKSDPHPADNLYPFLNTEEQLMPNESVSIPIEQSGIFTYHDENNPLIFKGIIIVQ